MAMPTIAVLGASGLIGYSLAHALRRGGFRVIAVARRFADGQAAPFGQDAVQCPIGTLDREALTRLLDDRGVDVVVNCLGVLQDGPRGSTRNVHEAFVGRLLAAMAALRRPALLLHLSVPGRPEDDATAFSRTKRAGERLIAAGGIPFIILRPGFVIAAGAYGGSALIRALAALPFRLPSPERDRVFAVTAVEDLCATVALVARRWAAGEHDWRATWDVMETAPSTVERVVTAFRERLGRPAPRLTAPRWMLDLGSRMGDAAAHLGWAPPVRTTALREMLRGVDGDPSDWIAATGLSATTPAYALAERPITVQERWFARLYLAKPMILAVLAAFWLLTGCLTLAASFQDAAAILARHGWSPGLASATTLSTSLADIAIGAAIGHRRTCRAGLWAGIGLSLVYMLGATLWSPELWLDPLGALVKIWPAIVLMIVGLAILDDR